MSDELSEDEIETLAWELETKMMEIRKDPRAALAAGLAKIRATMLAEMQADWEKMGAKRKADMAKFEAEIASLMAAKREAFEAKIEAKFEALQHDFHEIALELHRARALDEAIVERATTPDALLH